MLHYNYKGIDYQVQLVDYLPECASLVALTPLGDIWLGVSGQAYLI